MDMQKLSDIMGKFCCGNLATFSQEGYPDLRGWKFQFIREGKPFFTTSNEKNVYRQMAANPKATFACSVNGYEVRIMGDVKFAEDPALIEEIYNTMDASVRKLYPTVDSNGFTAMYFDHGIVKYAKDGGKFESFTF